MDSEVWILHFLSIFQRIHGKYDRLSNAIASDRARQEHWVLEFIDDTYFKAIGSSTGEDRIGA